MTTARPVRLARAAPASGASPVPPTPAVRRENAAATRRAVRLSILYAGALAAVYGGLVAVASHGPAAGTAGDAGALELAGLLALGLAAGGVLYALGSTPRAVELAPGATVVIGRWGHRYVFPPADRLATVVHERLPVSWLAPVPLASVEIVGGPTRRAFLLEEALLAPPP